MDNRREIRKEESTAYVHECIDDPDLEGSSIDCDIVDLSCHGLRLRTSHALVPNTLLNITVGVGKQGLLYKQVVADVERKNQTI